MTDKPDNSPLMAIPESFESGGSVISVQVMKTIRGAHGDWSSGRNLIRIRKDTPENMLQTFLHEYFHASLERYGHPEASENEGLVEALAQGFYQFLKTAE